MHNIPSGKQTFVYLHLQFTCLEPISTNRSISPLGSRTINMDNNWCTSGATGPREQYSSCSYSSSKLLNLLVVLLHIFNMIYSNKYISHIRLNEEAFINFRELCKYKTPRKNGSWLVHVYESHAILMLTKYPKISFYWRCNCKSWFYLGSHCSFHRIHADKSWNDTIVYPFEYFKCVKFEKAHFP